MCIVVLFTAMNDVTKQSDLSGFYRNLLKQTVGEESTSKPVPVKSEVIDSKYVLCSNCLMWCFVDTVAESYHADFRFSESILRQFYLLAPSRHSNTFLRYICHLILFCGFTCFAIMYFSL